MLRQRRVHWSKLGREKGRVASSFEAAALVPSQLRLLTFLDEMSAISSSTPPTLTSTSSSSTTLHPQAGRRASFDPSSLPSLCPFNLPSSSHLLLSSRSALPTHILQDVRSLRSSNTCFDPIWLPSDLTSGRKQRRAHPHPSLVNLRSNRMVSSLLDKLLTEPSLETLGSCEVVHGSPERGSCRRSARRRRGGSFPRVFHPFLSFFHFRTLDAEFSRLFLKQRFDIT